MYIYIFSICPPMSRPNMNMAAGYGMGIFFVTSFISAPMVSTMTQKNTPSGMGY